eukprot:TRINITY_DN47342_c0_g1_i1.p1 TRINITY_DN47342_c0_g1~~TRINITY_DN47342_c0_g1_i1.p1  ORF type:complete len:516 (+),score=116.76 TRINITY_DN47342_c0_g1_i1:123-1550(+)
MAQEDDLVDTSDGSVCEDRDDRWAAHGTNCSQMKRMCDDDGYSELVQAWCPVTCGVCVPEARSADTAPDRNTWSILSASDSSEAQNGSNESAEKAPKYNGSNGTQDFQPAAEAQFSKASAGPEAKELANGSNSSCPQENVSNGTCPSSSQGLESEDVADAVTKPEIAEASAPSANVSLANHSSPLGSIPSVGLIDGSLGSLQPPVKSSANISFPGSFQKDKGDKTSSRNLSNISAGKALLLLEELEEAEAAAKESGSFDLVSKFKFQIAGGSQALAGAVLDIEDADEIPRHAEGLDTLAAAGSTEVEEDDEESTCPEGWERVAGDVYGGDQWQDGWKHSAKSMKDCALSCLRQAGCGSFEWSPSKKRCYRNSQTRPTHEQDRQDFVFCRRRPCPSFKTKEACVGPGISAGYHSKEVLLKAGSYCIWSGGHCQAPMACTASDCFLPDGGLPGMELPSRYTLWISKAGLQASMPKLR